MSTSTVYYTAERYICFSKLNVMCETLTIVLEFNLHLEHLP